jgi:hypothetical protein
MIFFTWVPPPQSVKYIDLRDFVVLSLEPVPMGAKSKANDW